MLIRYNVLNQCHVIYCEDKDDNLFKCNEPNITFFEDVKMTELYV